MNGTRDTHETAAADDGSGFEPREAAALFEQTRRQARRQLEVSPTWLWLVRAAVILACYGGIWLSVRGQHPYRGPSGVALVVGYGLGAVLLRTTFAVRQRGYAAVTAWLRRG